MINCFLKIRVYTCQCATSLLMHDGTTCHRSRVVSEYLTKSMVAVLDWLGINPDLNSIKILWSYMKIEVAENQPPNATELVIATKEV